MISHLLWIFLLLLLPHRGVAGDSKPKELFEKFIAIGEAEVFAELPIYSFYLQDPAIHGVAYVPNFAPRLGLHVGWKEIGISTSFALPLPDYEIERRGHTEQTNLLISKYWRNLGLNIYYQFYRGFYIASPWSELDRNRPSKYPQLPDAEIINFGFNFYYVIDSERYSLSAAFSQGEFQNESGGSRFLMPFFNHVKLTRGTKFTRGTDPNAIQAPPDLRNTQLDTLGVAYGYGYSWIRERYFLAAQGGLGPGIQYQQAEGSQGLDSGGFNLAAALNMNLSAGRNITEGAYGVRVILGSLYSNVSGLPFYSTLANLQLFYGLRF